MPPSSTRSNTIDLKEVMLTTERSLVAKLTGTRMFVKHAPSKGTITEEAWREAICKFLPRRYTVSTNVFVVGAKQEISGQIDLAIHDAHFCPLFFEDGGVRFIPAESVFAIFDCKQTINAETLEATEDKVESVRRIYRTNREIVERGHIQPPRPEFDIIGGILALESGWAELLGDPFHEHIDGVRSNKNRRLDVGCALSSGAFEVRYPKRRKAQIDGTTEAPLMFFLMRLFSLLQAVGSPMVIDLREYSGPLETLDEIPAQ